MRPEYATVTFQDSQWQKVSLPVKRNWLFVVLFSACLVIWIAMLAGIVGAMFRERFGFVLNVMLVIWIIIWLWFGRVLWRRWQYYVATRELLFINPQELVLRRPVLILGSTSSFDMNHVSPFYYSDKHACPAFDYAFQHVYFGRSLSVADAQDLIATINDRYFPDIDDD